MQGHHAEPSRGMPLPQRGTWRRRTLLANKPCPCLRWRQACRVEGKPLPGVHELVYCSAHYVSVGTVLQEQPLCGCEAHYGRQPRSQNHPEATEIRTGRLARLPLIRGTCRQPAPPPSLPSVKLPPLLTCTHTLFFTAVIIAIASLDFHSQARSCTACLLMRN